MPIAVTIDQRQSRSSEDRVDEVVAGLNDRCGRRLRLPFVRTVGDEAQALLGDASALVAIVRALLADGGWWVGVGVGAVELPLAADARSSRGPCFYAAREAVEDVKSGRRAHRIEVRAADAGDVRTRRLAQSVEALEFVITRRTPSQRRIAAFALDGLSARHIAEELGVTRQSVTKQLSMAGFREEVGLADLTADLAGEAAAGA